MWYRGHEGKLLLAAIPAALFAGLFVVSPMAKTKSVEPRQPSYAEQVHVAPFSVRFGNPLPTENRVRTIPIVRELPPPAPQPSSPAVAGPPVQQVPAPAVRRIRVVRKASLEQALCRRHNMRTVHYGKRWRCRR